jgi:predicted metallo-beta-lactamase superfamily hydrolase
MNIMASDEPGVDSVNSSLFEDSTGHTIQDYPGEIENQYLLGVDDSGGWYYDPISKSIHNYQLEGGIDNPLELKLQFSMEEDEVEEAFRDISELAEDLVDRTVLGHALVLSSKLHENTHMSKPQSKVYSLREVYGVGRTQTARILDKSPNTVDNQRNSAKRKAQMAKEFVRIIREYSPN